MDISIKNKSIDLFSISERVEYLFSSLKGAYSRIAIKEKWKGKNADLELAKKMHDRGLEISSLKIKTIELPLKEQEKIIEELTPELRKILEFELTEYRILPHILKS